jgi:hypothetical protein
MHVMKMNIYGSPFLYNEHDDDDDDDTRLRFFTKVCILILADNAVIPTETLEFIAAILWAHRN